MVRIATLMSTVALVLIVSAIGGCSLGFRGEVTDAPSISAGLNGCLFSKCLSIGTTE
jgi:hypothetical protein